MTTTQKIKEPVVSKLHLDLEDLKTKYDHILPQMSQAMEHVKDSDVRRQLECLYSDVYSTFLQPELESQPNQCVDLVEKCVQESSNFNKDVFLDTNKQKGIPLTRISKLDQAKALQKQVEYIDGYFEKLLDSLQGMNQMESSRRPAVNTVSRPVELSCLVSIPTMPDTPALATLNRTDHCSAATASSGSRGGEVSSPRRDLLLNLPSELGSTSGCTTGCTTSGIQETSGADRQSQSNIDKSSVRLKEKHSILLDKPPACRRAQSNRGSKQVTRKFKWVVKGAPDFPLNLPPRYMRSSASFSLRSKRCPCLHPCRKVLYSSGDHYSVEPNTGSNTNNANHPAGCYSPYRECVAGSGYSFSSESLEGETSRTSQNKKRPLSVSQSSARRDGPHISCLIENVETIGVALQERRARVCTLRKNNRSMKKQIIEVETTIESFDKYLKNLENEPNPPSSDAMKREMYAFQEVLIGAIFTCMEVLTEEMKALRNKEQTKAAKVRAFLTRYGVAKRATPEALLVFDGLKDDANSSNQCAAVSVSCDNLKQSLQAVVTGIDGFHTSCEDIWDDTLTRVFSELDTMFTFLPSPPTKRWSPDDPCLPTCLSLSSLNVLEDDMCTLTKLVEDKSKYGALIILSLRFLERLTNEFDRLMIVTRIKDLQLISIDHSIGLAYMSMRQMVLPTTKILPTQNSFMDSEKKSLNSKTSKKKRKPHKFSEKKFRSPINDPNEQNAKTNQTFDNADTVITNKEKQGHRKQQIFKDGDEDPNINNKIQTCDQSQQERIKHMSAAVDMHLPFFHTDDCAQKFASTGAMAASTSWSSELSPWPQQDAKKETHHKQKTTGEQKKSKRKSARNSATLPQTSRKPSAENSTKPPLVNTEKDMKLKQESELVGELELELDKDVHRSIQNCKVPFLTNLFTEENKTTNEQGQADSKRKQRFRLTATDQSARDFRW